jgi:hypothetical protein
VLVAELMVARHRNVCFHEQTRGCLFDYNEERASIVRMLRRLRIEPGCLSAVPSADRAAAAALVAALAAHQRAPR